MSTCFPLSARCRCDIDQVWAEEVRFVDPHHFSPGIQIRKNVGGALDGLRFHAQIVMGNDFVGGIAVVDERLEDLHAFPGDDRTPEPPHQLLALA
jgi:hypothetical protein